MGYINLTDSKAAFATTESLPFRTRQPTFASICLSHSSYFSSHFSLLLRLLDTFVVNLTHPFTVVLGTVSQPAPTASTSTNGVQLVQHLENPVRAGFHSAAAWVNNWTWTGGTGVKSYTDLQLNEGINKQLSAINSMPVRLRSLLSSYKFIDVFNGVYSRHGLGARARVDRLWPTSRTISSRPPRLVDQPRMRS